MGRAVRFATAGVALAVALTTSACGASGAAAPVAGSVGPTSGAAGAPTATTSDDVPVPDDTTTTDNPFASPPSPSVHEGELRNALLPPNAFGSGLKYQSDSPQNGQFPAPNVPDDSMMTCDLLITGGPDSRSIAYAYAGIDNTNPSGLGYYEAARQYSHEIASETLGEIETKAHSLCGSYDSKDNAGTPEKNDITVTAQSGVGDAADLVEQVTTFPTKPYEPLVFEGLVAQYGDLLITVVCSGSRSEVKNCDLVTKVKTIAGKLTSQ